MNPRILVDPLPLTRARLIQASAEMADWKDAQVTLLAIVVTTLIIGLALVASAVLQ